MRKLTLVCMALILIAGTAMAAGTTGIKSTELIHSQYPSVPLSNATNGAKVDTVFIIGEPVIGAPTFGTGQFQQDGNPSMPDNEGWIGVDRTFKDVSKWHIDSFNAENLGVAPNNAMYCGEVFAGCSEFDAPEGYGHDYREYLDWYGTVDDAGAATTVNVQAVFNYDTEENFDYLYLTYETASEGWLLADDGVTVGEWTGNNKDEFGEFQAVSLNIDIDYAMNDYVGTGDQVHLRFEGISDSGYDDADCYQPTSGLAQIDNIIVSGTNGIVGTTDDFESGMAKLINWELAYPPAVGNFWKVWPQLGSLDPCTVNRSPQVAFIDDGIVEDCGGVGGLGTPGAFGHAYAVLGGWAVNLLGGCGGEAEHMQNEMWSPELDWPVGSYVGAEFSFATYLDLPLNNGMFYVWHVNSTDASGVWTGWQDRNFVYYGDPVYGRSHFIVTDLIVQSPTKIRLALGCNELGYVWGLVGNDPTPSPYFDEVAFRVWPSSGPEITTRELEMAQDNFPTSGSVAFGADLDIRFDMANDIIGEEFAAIVPGDSLAFDIVAVRPFSTINGLPKLYWTMKQNPAFDASFRTNLEFGAATSGVTDGVQVTIDGSPVPDRYSFDLPDDDFFFPGDVIHYYIYAEDIVDTDVDSQTFPENRAGFGVFDDIYNPDVIYPSAFTVHGLPTLNLNVAEDGYTQPSILFWNDFANRGAENEWYFALSQLGYQRHEDFDIYYTNAPSSGVSNGLGSRATATQLAGYSTMLYCAGNLGDYTLADYAIDSEKSNDILLVETWLNQGDKNLFMTGDEILYDLSTTNGGSGAAFMSNWMGVSYIDNDVANDIGGQTSAVIASSHATAIDLPRDFIAFGSCPSINTFDQFIPLTGTVPLAMYTTALGVDTAYPAVTYKLNDVSGSVVVFAGVDFSYWYTVASVPAVPGELSSRAENLEAILTSFGESPKKGAVTAAPAAKPFFARNYPNPFNPITKIEFSVPKAGNVSVKIFNVRGELVRTLVDEHMDAKDLVVREWNGTNNRGAAVASGVYFYETRTNGNVQVNKMALVK